MPPWSRSKLWSPMTHEDQKSPGLFWSSCVIGDRLPGLATTIDKGNFPHSFFPSPITPECSPPRTSPWPPLIPLNISLVCTKMGQPTLVFMSQGVNSCTAARGMRTFPIYTRSQHTRSSTSQNFLPQFLYTLLTLLSMPALSMQNSPTHCRCPSDPTSLWKNMVIVSF